MSATVRIKTSHGDVQAQSSVGITTFSGGSERGRMIQITIGNEYVQLTPSEAVRFGIVLEYAEEKSLEDFPHSE